MPLQTKIEVQLYKDEAPQGSRKVKGRFDSAATDFITLTLKDGQTRPWRSRPCARCSPADLSATMAGWSPWRFPFCYWNSILAASRPALQEGFMATQ